VTKKQIIGAFGITMRQEELLKTGKTDKYPNADRIPIIHDADTSLDSVLVDALLGKNIVVTGHSDTTKSQTITNLIAASMYHGKSVLFVSEKKTTLEEIRRKLDNVGLGDFCLEIHGHKTPITKFHDDIRRRIEQNFFDPKKTEYDKEDLQNEQENLQVNANPMSDKAGLMDETLYEILGKAERWGSKTSENSIHLNINNPFSLSRKDIDDRNKKLGEVAKLHEELSSNGRESWLGFSPKILLPGKVNEIRLRLSALEKKTTSYRSYLSHLLTAHSIPIQLTIANLRKLSSINLQFLSKMPENFNEKIALKLFDSNVMQAFDEVWASIKRNEKLMIIVRDAFAQIPELSIGHIKDIHGEPDAIASIELGNSAIQDLDGSIQVADKALEHLNGLLGISDNIGEISMEKLRTLNGFIKYTELAKLVNEAPEDVVANCYPHHVLSLAPVLLKRAQREFTKISRQLDSFSDFIDLSKLPKLDEIIKLSSDLKKYSVRAFSFLSFGFHRTRRKTKRFLIYPFHIKWAYLPMLLDQLADIVKSRSDASNNSEYKHILGPFFRGTTTDWDRLDVHMAWVQSLRRAAGSDTAAEKIVQNFANYNELLVNTSEQIKYLMVNVKDSLDKLHITFERNTKVENLISEVKKVKEKLSLAKSAIHEMDKLNDDTGTSKRIANLIGTHFNGIHTDIKPLESIAEWIYLLQFEGNVPRPVVKWIVSQDTSQRIIILNILYRVSHDFVKEFDKFLDGITNFGNLDMNLFFGGNEENCTVGMVDEKVNDCLQNISFLTFYSDYCRAVAEANSMGLQEVTHSINTQIISAKDAVFHYKESLYRSMARELIKKHPALRFFARSDYEDTRSSFAEPDKKIIQITRERVAYEISKRKVPKGIKSGLVNNLTELELINSELRKRKQHISIRQLIKRAGNALQALKPCFMMSPVTAAQYVEREQIKFDMVIMDAHSQLKPEGALGPIARSSQCIIV
jgi:hypothetical protein